MKKSMLVVLILLGLFLGFYSTSLAQTSLTTSASMPLGALSVTVTPIDSKGTDDNGVDDTWLAAATSLTFGALKEVKGVDPILGPWVVFLPANNYYFAIDVGFTGGGTVTGKSVTFSYLTTPGPNGDKLGKKVVSRYFKITKDLLSKDVYNELIAISPRLIETATPMLWDTYINTGTPGWLRSLVGIYTGKPDLRSTLPTVETFSPADPVGSYSGTLVVTFA